jgi:hypothetical protein
LAQSTFPLIRRPTGVSTSPGLPGSAGEISRPLTRITRSTLAVSSGTWGALSPAGITITSRSTRVPASITIGSSNLCITSTGVTNIVSTHYIPDIQGLYQIFCFSKPDFFVTIAVVTKTGGMIKYVRVFYHSGEEKPRFSSPYSHHPWLAANAVFL